MADELYALTADQVTELGKLLRDYRAGRLTAPSPPMRSVSGAPVESYTATVTEPGGIDALTGIEPGTGTASLYTIDDAGELVDLEIEEDVYNLSETAIDEAAVVTVVREPVSGRLVVTTGGGGGGGGINISEADGTPSYFTTSITLDQVTGLVLGVGGAVSLAAASVSQAGIITTGPQTIGTIKSFVDIGAAGVINKPIKALETANYGTAYTAQFTDPANSSARYAYLFGGPYYWDAVRYLYDPTQATADAVGMVVGGATDLDSVLDRTEPTTVPYGAAMLSIPGHASTNLYMPFTVVACNGLTPLFALVKDGVAYPGIWDLTENMIGQKFAGGMCIYTGGTPNLGGLANGNYP